MFSGRVISRRTEILWLVHSPELTPLDYWPWGLLEKDIGEEKPEDIAQLKLVVEAKAERIEVGAVHNAVENIRKKVALCRANGGGHFEAQM